MTPPEVPESAQKSSGNGIGVWHGSLDVDRARSHILGFQVLVLDLGEREQKWVDGRKG